MCSLSIDSRRTHSAGCYAGQTLDVVQHVDIVGLLFPQHSLCNRLFSEAKSQLISCEPNPVSAEKNVTSDKGLERMGSNNTHKHTHRFWDS